MTSPDLTDANIGKLAELFPSVVTEALDADGNPKKSIDFDLLRQELSGHLVDGQQERYQLDWPGKRDALRLANSPTTSTLRPLREDSVNFDVTQNLLIEGDNLDALKLLQESYLGKVKLIYIDPPYNTGGDLVYRDNFTVLREKYQEAAGQIDSEGNRLIANPDTSGRYHSDWLTMIYPRLKLANRLLAEDGVIMISIDDSEQASLRRLADEVFGERNFISQLVWEKGRKNDAKFFSNGHEYLLVYAKSKSYLRELDMAWREEKPGAREIWDEYVRLRERFGTDDPAIERELTNWFAALPKSDPSKKWARYKRIDANGPWRDDNISWPGGGGPVYDVLHPRTGLPCKVPERGWIWSDPAVMQSQIDRGVVVFREDHTQPPFRKSHLRPIPEEASLESDQESETDLAVQVRGTYFYKQSQVAIKHLRGLMGAQVFNNPKDHVELSRLFEYVLNGREGIVMDFFAGSGSTAEAVFELSARTGLNCPVILVQLPESLEENYKSTTGSARTTVSNAIDYLTKRGRALTITELTKDRVALAGKRFLVERKQNGWNGDVGFRSLRIDSTNMTDVLRSPEETNQLALDLLEGSVKPGRSGEDLLFQVLLDWGLELTMPIDVEDVDGHEVFVVEDGALIACFEPTVSPECIRSIAKREPLRAVFRDSGFASDAARINAEQVFREMSPATDVKAI